jgi:putative tryptophan/tyrosine transport system substrate-binding protein
MFDMKRREFITLLGGAAAWPLAARAQQRERVRRIGVLMGRAESDPEGQSFAAAFLRGLAALGWMPGRNLKIDSRSYSLASPIRWARASFRAWRGRAAT